MSGFDKPMTTGEFNEALQKLGVSVYASAGVLGISLRQAQRYSSGEESVPWRTTNHLRVLLFNVDGLKKQRKCLLKQIRPLQSGTSRFYNGGKDSTAAVLNENRRQLAECEHLLTNHPAGIKPGLD
jgi:hypothetical protein